MRNSRTLYPLERHNNKVKCTSEIKIIRLQIKIQIEYSSYSVISSHLFVLKGRDDPAHPYRVLFLRFQFVIRGVFRCR